MENKKFYYILGVVLAAVAIFVIWGINQPKEVNAPGADDSGTSEEIIYFYGKECPHCLDVAKFLEENKIAEKVSFSKKEVWHNTFNNSEMLEKAKGCGLDPKKIGVPFLYARGECLIGTPDTVSFFSQEAGLESSSESTVPAESN
ncbi:MAG: hypothetical protein COU40_00305 [Candidatus Moranbacteria bacterium CG10_big_fil_rev_8_21_14_0_10_35_21]|nr:MAG: hypothetical protein COU40_00305 [Candidatus Moranbacteria bacterium CG10_big_fil_rev_8_21_14_0_10_35_21]PJA88337.1 MAG: hypothetical protein CO139_03615 [Candidatus Moranbacteria bacterium CG_4_9_14_3_um_filter_36_9]